LSFLTKIVDNSLKDFNRAKTGEGNLRDLFFMAAVTERKLPRAIRKQKMNSWPEYVQEWSGYGYSEFEPKEPRPSPAEISSYENMLFLSVEKMNSDDRKLVWMVSHSAVKRDRGPAFSKIAKIMGLRDGRQVKRRFSDALVRLSFRIQNDQEDELLADIFS